MTDPTYFTVLGPILVPGDDSSDGGVLPDLVAPTSGKVIFSYNIGRGEMFRLTGSPSAAILSRSETAIIQSDGSFLRLKDDGTVGGLLYLMANTAALNLDGDLTINVRFTDLVLPNGKKVGLSPFDFIAPVSASTVIFGDIVPRPGTKALGVAQGPQGVGFDGTGHVNLDNTVQFGLTNGQETVPLNISNFSVDGINGGTPAGTGIGILGGGAP